MRSSSGNPGLLRIFIAVVAISAALGYFGHVRAQESNNPGIMKIPLRPMAPLSSVAVPPVFGIEGLLADKMAAIPVGQGPVLGHAGRERRYSGLCQLPLQCRR